MEKVGFGRVRVYPKFEMSGTGISGIEKLGFGRVRVLKVRVRADISGMKKEFFHSKVQRPSLLDCMDINIL